MPSDARTSFSCIMPTKVDYPKGLEIFAQFAEEEQQHLALIRDAYNQLQAQGEW